MSWESEVRKQLETGAGARVGTGRGWSKARDSGITLSTMTHMPYAARSGASTVLPGPACSGRVVLVAVLPQMVEI